MKKKLYDFYFSPEQRRIILSVFRDRKHITLINGKEYTEMIEHGKKPVSKFNDLTKVCTNHKDGIEIKELT